MEITRMRPPAGAIILLLAWLQECFRRQPSHAVGVALVAAMLGCKDGGGKLDAVASEKEADGTKVEMRIDEAAGSAVEAAQRVLRWMPDDVESVLAVRAPTRKSKNFEGGSSRVTRRNGQNVILRVDRTGQEHEMEHKNLQEELFDGVSKFEFLSTQPNDLRIVALPKDGLQWCVVLGREVRGKDRAEEDLSACTVFQYEKLAADKLERELITLAVESTVLRERSVIRVRVPISYPPISSEVIKPVDVDNLRVNRLPKPVLPTETVDVWVLRLTDNHLAFFDDEQFARESAMLDPEASSGLALTKELDRVLPKDPDCYCWGMRRFSRGAPFHHSSFLNYCATATAVTFRYDAKSAGVCNIDLFGSGNVNSKQVRDYMSNVAYWDWEDLASGEDGDKAVITNVDAGTVHIQLVYRPVDSFGRVLEILAVLGLQGLPTSL